ncbi:MAG TPA: hypothetical protein VF338_12955, partial [Leptolinea sp.]
PSGVYAITASTPQRMVLPGKWESLQHFDRSGSWVALMKDEAGIIRPDGSTASIKGVESVVTVSPDGKSLLLNKTGAGTAIYSSDGSLLASLSDKPLKQAFFTPDSQKAYLTIDYNLYTASAPDWKVQQIPEGTTILGWVGF